MNAESMLAFGDAVKAMGGGRVGGYLVRFSTAADPDLAGEYFTKSTYYGPRAGDGADMLFNHSFPIKAEFAGLADHIFRPITTKADEIGIWAEAVLDLANSYEKKVYELARDGKLGWSSGAPGHMVRRKSDGEITRWPIAEGSLTPTPAEPRARVTSIKALSDGLARVDLTCVKAANIKTIRDVEQFLRDEGSFSNGAATALMAHLKAIFQGELGDSADAKRELAEVKAKVVDLRYQLLRARMA